MQHLCPAVQESEYQVTGDVKDIFPDFVKVGFNVILESTELQVGSRRAGVVRFVSAVDSPTLSRWALFCRLMGMA